MIPAVVAAVVAVVAFAIAGPMLVRALPPAIAVRLLAPAQVLTALSSAVVLGVIAFLWLGQLSAVAYEGDWSAAALSDLDPFGQSVSIAAGLLLVPALAWACLTLCRQLRAIATLYRAERELPSGDNLTILDSPDLDAFTLPSGRIVITRALHDVLNPTELSILIAHEESHRRHRHAWWGLAVDLAGAMNPMLRVTATAIHEATERWADEDAAAVAERGTVATTIARVALLRTDSQLPLGARAAAAGPVVRRVHAMLGPPPRLRAYVLALVAVLTGAVLIATIAVSAKGEELIDEASVAQTIS